MIRQIGYLSFLRINRYFTRHLTSGSGYEIKKTGKRKKYKLQEKLPSQILVSTCFDIFYNLALEDWIYNNVHIDDSSTVLFLYRNNPCVVIGRHQNPWRECNVDLCSKQNVPVARRNSGGGTVYHDRGNLNCSFFTTQRKYDRKRNLDLMVQALKNEWNLNVSISDRDDILLDNKYKVSGTAAKLGGGTAYHHCTLLFDTNVANISQMLHSPLEKYITTKASLSVKSDVQNLCSTAPSVSYQQFIGALVNLYRQCNDIKDTMEYVDPTKEKKFTGISSMAHNLRSWDWLFKKTPKFTLFQKWQIPYGFPAESPLHLDLELIIDKGVIQDLNYELSQYDQSINQEGSTCERQVYQLYDADPSGVMESLCTGLSCRPDKDDNVDFVRVYLDTLKGQTFWPRAINHYE